MRVVLIKTDSVQGSPPLLYLGTSEDTPSDSFPQAGCAAGPSGLMSLASGEHGEMRSKLESFSRPFPRLLLAATFQHSLCPLSPGRPCSPGLVALPWLG